MVRSGGKVSMARIGVTGLSGNSFRAVEAEKKLEGSAGAAEDIAKAVAGIADGVDANSDVHASADYRRHLARVFAARALTEAVARAK